ncbi:DUF1254 domain-containing protein [Nitratireductor sp. OM-1]|uniref:DUF1254 domain-containing protein n=1 Tax=Nitratireductor sp. OM-1 TaxID=1756988 RepID=UPI001FE1BC6B|nr:DUF1254 domain-containing protein [Nitratireductor sp. OM-1]
MIPFKSPSSSHSPMFDAGTRKVKVLVKRSAAISGCLIALAGGALAQGGIPVNADNFVRAESDLYFSGVVANGGFGKFDHTREMAPLDKQTVIRLNRDTLYSSAVFDLEAGPVTITLPESGDRFMSMQVINEDHFTNGVYYDGGEYTLERDEIGTRYVMVAIRSFANPASADDMAAVHELQDQISVSQESSGNFDIPDWDAEERSKTRQKLLALAEDLPDLARSFGAKNEVDPVRHLIGAASGWGGNPDAAAFYLNVVPEKNDGETVYRMNVGDVPVDGFWSVSVYNKSGFFEPNEIGVYTLNNVTSDKNKDGSVTIQFGDCSSNISNCIPVPADWNYMIRLYRPHPAVLSGDWQFPVVEEVK